jgi:hypothetical protein
VRFLDRDAAPEQWAVYEQDRRKKFEKLRAERGVANVFFIENPFPED